jgi:hypothetical protein
MKIFTLALSIALLTFTTTNINPIDNLGVDGPLSFNNTSFELKWSDKPSDIYYIQEYLPSGEDLDNFNQMITIHLFDTDIKLKDAVDQKLSELNKRKETDSVCNYQVTESPDGKEFIIDFLLGESKEDKMTIVEFNVYHYRQIELDNNRNAIAVYAYSKRSYGDNITDFFKTLKEDRISHLNEMISIQKPIINIRKE